VSWGSGPAARPPSRDESDASIRFDLPDLPPDPPAAGTPPVAPPATTDTPRRVAQPTAATTHPPPAPNPRPPGSPDKKKGFTRPPLLPAAPLVYGAPVAPPPVGTPGPVEADPNLPPPPDPGATDLKDQESAVWKRVKRNVLFWKAPTDPVRVGVFGPAVVAHSETPRLTVFLYPVGAAESVATLARAFRHDAVLLGTGAVAQPLARNAKLAVHVAVAHTAVTTPLCTFAWQGQPHRLTFDLVVPWEAPDGPAAGVVSVGQDDVRIGKVEFKLHVRPRKG
jgi:hypothetical protein